jgi:carbamoyl-phosphate synthase large subunit
LGRSFPEALNKAMRSMETREAGFWTRPDPAGATRESTLAALATPHDGPTVHNGAVRCGSGPA